jgi:hypothetical protein
MQGVLLTQPDAGAAGNEVVEMYANPERVPLIRFRFRRELNPHP